MNSAHHSIKPKTGAYSAIREPEARAHYVENGQRHQPAPSEVHKLVIAEARQRAAHPHVEKQETENLQDKPEDGQQCANREVVRRWQQIAKWTSPAAQKQQGGYATHHDHVGVF